MKVVVRFAEGLAAAHHCAVNESGLTRSSWPYRGMGLVFLVLGPINAVVFAAVAVDAAAGGKVGTALEFGAWAVATGALAITGWRIVKTPRWVQQPRRPELWSVVAFGFLFLWPLVFLGTGSWPNGQLAQGTFGTGLLGLIASAPALRWWQRLRHSRFSPRTFGIVGGTLFGAWGGAVTLVTNHPIWLALLGGVTAGVVWGLWIWAQSRWWEREGDALVSRGAWQRPLWLA